MKSKECLDVGYLVSSWSKSTMSSFKERSNDASKIGIRLCLIELTDENLKAVRKSNKIKVRVWSRNSFLKEIQAPLPKVIYDRTAVANPNSKVDLFVEALVYAKCVFLNSPEVRKLARDKWEQYKFFVTRGVKIPETAKYSLSELGYFLSKGMVFIKPRSGSEGKRQIVIKKYSDKKNCFKITTTFGRKKVCFVNGVGGVKDFLSRFSLENYIIQSGVKIDFITEETSKGIRLRSYDWRVIVQRTTSGKPVVTIAFVRVGPPKSDQANISQGGHPQDPESVFEDYKKVVSDVSKKAVKIFNLLAESYTISEMAFDFVQDESEEDGEWFIEMNSRPGTSGPRTLREWVPTDKAYARKGVILFEAEYSNTHRLKWGARFLAFRVLPFYYAKTLLKNKT